MVVVTQERGSPATKPSRSAFRRRRSRESRGTPEWKTQIAPGGCSVHTNTRTSAGLAMRS